MQSLWVIYGLRLSYERGYRYVGMTSKGADYRLGCHRREARAGLDLPKHRWMLKNGTENVVADVLETCPEDDWDSLAAAEQRWILRLRVSGHDLLNVSEGGLGNRGLKHSEDVKRAQSERVSGENNPMFGAARSGPDAPRYGMKNSPEHNKKLSEHRLDPNHPWRGSKHRPESIELMARRRKEFWTPERRAKQSETMSGRTRSPEHRANLSKAKKGKPSRAMHKRWHLNRDIVNPDCIFCNP